MFSYIEEIMNDPMGMLLFFILALPGRLLAISMHEAAHAWVANRCGDPTARLMGRVTLNPFKHLDPIGVLMMVLFGFGWAKPVPVNPLNFKNYRKDDLKVSLAGVTMNLILFCVGAVAMYGIAALALAQLPYIGGKAAWMTKTEMFRTVIDGQAALVSGDYYYLINDLLKYGAYISEDLIVPVFGQTVGYLYEMLGYFVTTNMVLAVFNLIPLPPLDGYHVLNDLLLKRPLFADARAQHVGMSILYLGIFTGVLTKALNWVYSGIWGQVGKLAGWVFGLFGIL